MFHVKDDARSRRSARLMYAGLRRLLDEKALPKVTVSDVSRVSTVGRATFYRSFDEVCDILWWHVDAEFSRVLGSFVRTHPAFERAGDLLEYLLRYWTCHSADLENLMDAGRLDVIYQCFASNAGVVTDYLRSIGKDISTNHLDYFVATRAGFFVGVFKAWLANGKRETPEEVARIVAEQHEQVVRAGVLA